VLCEVWLAYTDGVCVSVLATVAVCITEGVKDINEEFETIGETDELDESDGL
jgi:hypothetical protein